MVLQKHKIPQNILQNIRMGLTKKTKFGFNEAL